MEGSGRRTLRAVFAALLFLAGGVVLVIVRPGPDGSSAEGPASEPAQPLLAEAVATVFPAEGATWLLELGRDDGEYLMGLFFDALEALGDAGPLPAIADGPEACLREVSAPVFVTVYLPNVPPSRIMVTERNLAQSVVGAARQVFEGLTEATAPARPEANRVRIDVILEAAPFPVASRKAFAEEEFGEPVGVALQSGSKTAFFLPGDIADSRANRHVEALHVVCRDTGLSSSAWREPSVTMWRLRAAGFVNTAPGSRHALESPRGLTPVGQLTLAKLLRSCRLAGGYLVDVQRKDGTFLANWDPASNLRAGCDSLPEQAAAAGALGVLCELRSREEYVKACYESLSHLMQFTEEDPRDPRMFFARRREVCREFQELEATASVLAALCHYHRASGLAEPEDWIAALAEFLLYMQREDGLFELAYDPETGTRSTPLQGASNRKAIVPQARAALALCLAHREVDVPRFLVGARRALDRLQEQDRSRAVPYSATEARWLASALLECSAFVTAGRYEEWASRIALARREAQLGGNDAPAEDLAGGTRSALPPRAGPTADDLVVFTSVCMMNPETASESLGAARQAARYLMRLQYLEENSYYLPHPDDARGGFREQPGTNVVQLGTLEATLRGLVNLARLELQRSQND